LSCHAFIAKSKGKAMRHRDSDRVELAVMGLFFGTAVIGLLLAAVATLIRVW
jgi:hypothetical protein